MRKQAKDVLNLGTQGRLQRTGDPSEPNLSRVQEVIKSRLLFSVVLVFSD
ncbi:MAG TPA: hypothetical protein GXZ26_09365 [Firmicutes bacterium]|nr:hypothetical protein [Bacillota bacterium]